ncbi:hypothetical protein LQZ21_09395 [Treponema sp. TIM-1]|uniref:hypothetical protein n=1 Tax=Treponema sp. TIM-1 TaxID=2898417 RepID=UPI00397F8646
MMETTFRSPEDWKSALMTLPDSSYFELFRSIFGNVKTPFNKQRLLEDLAVFLSRGEIQEVIAAYIDETDHRIITAIAVLENPVPGELESFFAGELTYAELHSKLLNLEERLIVYRFREEGAYRLALNPILKSVLAPLVADTGVLFPSLPPDRPGNKKPAGPTAPVLAAFLAFVLERPEFFKAGGGIRKKVFEEGQLIFPGINLEALAGAWLHIGLLRDEGDRLTADVSRFRAFSELSPRDRREYHAAGLLLYLRGDNSGYFHRGRLQFTVRFIHGFLEALEAGRRYPEATLKRITEVLFRQETKSPNRSVIDTDLILDALEKTGLMERGEGDWWIPCSAVPAEPDLTRPVIVPDTASSFLLYPEIGFADALKLAFFCSVRETGTAVRFELTRESAVRGFDRNISSPEMLDLLERLSGKKPDSSLAWNLKEWESRYSGVTLHRGVVLTLSEDRRYLAEAKPVAALISRTLAPGVYLLAAEEKAEAAEALQKAGVDIIAQQEGNAPPEEAKPPGFRHFPYPALEGANQSLCSYNRPGMHKKENAVPLQEKTGGGEQPLLPDPEKAETYKKRFRSVLVKMQIPKPEWDELSARIDRRLILSESQLVGVSVRFEKLEARGLDYVGKSTVAREALASKSLLEILVPGPGEEPNRVMGIPLALDKREGETLLVLKSMPQGEEIRLPLGKISLLRRIKHSIFGD